MRANAVAVGADEIAFHDFPLVAREAAKAHECDDAGLGRWVAVIEVHGTGREAAATVHAGDRFDPIVECAPGLLEEQPFFRAALLQIVSMVLRFAPGPIGASARAL